MPGGGGGMTKRKLEPVKQLAVERDGHNVLLTVQCADTYEAIMLFEELIQAARNKWVTLSVGIK
jgi:hypothetical protein